MWDLVDFRIAAMKRFWLPSLVLSCFAFADFPVTAGEDGEWWSLQPLKKPSLPAGESKNGIDRFITAKHAELGLNAVGLADQRTLVRRLYFDLWGLPPAPEEVENFVSDSDPEAYAKLVDKLLASPRYGERWARHWLDVVHYGETHGYDKDQPRPNAWPYRDYVIRAFNEDKPYARFVKEQLAGDALWPDTVDGIVATGFIAAGPWDLIGHAEVPEEKIDGKVARHLDRDDMVTTTMNAFCSLTVQCAQCHDHKRDPVTMKDYYALQSVFAALDRADRPYDESPEVAAKRGELAEKQKELKAEQKEIDKKIAAAKPKELIELEKEIAKLEEKLSAGSGAGGAKRSERYGYHSQVAPKQDTVKWVQVDLGEKLPIDHVILVGADEYGFADFGFPHRFKVEVADEPEFKTPRVLLDQAGADFARPGATPVSIEGGGKIGRYVRITGTKLWSRRKKGQSKTSDWIFAIGEMAVISGGKLAGVVAVTALDSIEAGPRWQKKNLIDGIYGAHSLDALVGSGTSPTNGYHSAFAKNGEVDTPKWVQIDLGESTNIERIELFPAYPTDFRDNPGFGFPVRFRLGVSDDPEMKNATVLADHSAADYPNPRKDPAVFKAAVKGRYVRLAASQLDYPEGSGGPMLAMGEMRVFSGGTEVSRSAKVTSLDSINSGRWHRKHLVDGYTSRRRIGDDAAEELVRLANVGNRELRGKLKTLVAKRDELASKSLDPELQKTKTEIAAALTKVDAALKALAKPKMVYAGTIHAGSGTFKGRGHVGGKPRDIYVLHRGDVTQPRDPVKPATVPGVVKGIPNEFPLQEDDKESARRVALAEWITHKENTLTWRSIVNRVWQYHFGRGIVDTPNDFGQIGELPSHPELLDWLAVEFRDGGGSIKNLHRLILNSDTYKRASTHDANNAKIDNSNQFLWRQNRRRLEAEAIRDTVLTVAGKMDFKMGGPSFKDFVIEKPQHSPHYQYHKYDPNDASTHRRSVYRFIVRSQPQPFMDTLDCADPSQLVDKRGETTTALQALAMLNNRFMVRMAEFFAERLKDEADPVGRAIELALARKPAEGEVELLRNYAQKHGLPAACRLIFNFNEFAFVD